jgi:hypothetical protein
MKLVALAGAVPTWAKLVSGSAASLRSILKPVSSLALSTQPSEAWPTPPVAVRSEGALGTVGSATVASSLLE